jgi:hypothetical protein
MIKKLKYIFVILTGLLSISCNDWLELRPENNIIREDFWQTKQQVESAVMGCYASLMETDLAQKLFLWAELRGDLLTNNEGCKTEYLNILNGTITPYNSVFDWKYFYRSINLCNTVLAYAKDALNTDPTFTESELLAYEAEALTIRALLYFYLVRSFRDVPLMLDAVTSDQINFFTGKSTENEILNQILSDLSIAEKNAVETYNNNDFDKGRVTKHTVRALQADIYLWKNEYDSCITACDKIINSKKFGLVPGNQWFEDIFFKGNSNEGIFELQFYNGKTNPYYGFFHPTQGSKYFLCSYIITSLYDNNDVRGDSATYWTENYPVVYKYLGTSTTSKSYRSTSNCYAHWIFYRYADILLMKAEALNEKGEGQQAANIIKRIQNRAMGGDTLIDAEDKDAMRERILLERQRELAYEGKRWYDVLRNTRRDYPAHKKIMFDMIESYATGDIVESMKNKVNDPNSLFFPIYYKEIESNKSLEQNPYYK